MKWSRMQSLTCLLRQNRFSEKEIQYFWEIMTCDPSIHKKDHPDFNKCSFMETSIGLKMVYYLEVDFLCLISVPSLPRAGSFGAAFTSLLDTSLVMAGATLSPLGSVLAGVVDDTLPSCGAGALSTLVSFVSTLVPGCSGIGSVIRSSVSLLHSSGLYSVVRTWNREPFKAWISDFNPFYSDGFPYTVKPVLSGHSKKRPKVCF